MIKNFSLSLTTKREFDLKINALLSENPSQALYVNVSDKPKKRSLSANAQQHVWYSQIAKSFDDSNTWFYAKNFCKLTFGMPIMLASDKHEPMLSFLIEKLDYYSYSYDSQIKLMDIMVHTSKFSKKESKIYMDEMIAFFNEQGVMINYQN